ncbi:hypothetical protein V6N11_018861 [Hibiscus sabdariffa]|uniref:Uncharacterized protein n=1 Tax=Hibiscus sabdariffa TaxID=183260 RepID=A0ABR2N678_9ROSI
MDDNSATILHSNPPPVLNHLLLALDPPPPMDISNDPPGEKENADRPSAKAKAKGKSALPFCKSHSLPLAMQNSNVITARQSPNLVSSGRINKGRAQSLSFIPSNQTSIILDVDANPVIQPSSLAMIASGSHLLIHGKNGHDRTYPGNSSPITKAKLALFALAIDQASSHHTDDQSAMVE